MLAVPAVFVNVYDVYVCAVDVSALHPYFTFWPAFNPLYGVVPLSATVTVTVCDCTAFVEEPIVFGLNVIVGAV